MQNTNNDNKPKKRVDFEVTASIVGTITSIIALVVALFAWLIPPHPTASWWGAAAVVGVIVTIFVLILTFVALLGTISGNRFVSLIKSLLERIGHRTR